MYYVTCDGYPLLDWRDDDLILVNPKVNLEVNTVGEGSFTIYKNHPHFDKLKKLKSVVEVSDENGVIFRGRMTGDTVDFDHGMTVDLEGVMAFFNDSIVRPFSFPKDFAENAEYNTAAASGNAVAFFLKWLIDNHNAQVQDFQKMKLGNVTVTDPNNYITRSSSNYLSTWDALKSKLFDSALGGYLCIRHEADGNYIDYHSDFTETNSQRVEYGENLLDLLKQTEASETYSAIIPIGAAGLTLEGLADGDITADLVKLGDTIYSRSAVAEYGWICAPTEETTWEDVTDDRNLRKKGAEWLANGGSSVLKAIEATAVDLHFTAEQAESLRIYKNVEVYSAPHGISETFPLSKLEIDLLNPQNTKVKVGKTLMSLTERTAIQEDEALLRYSKLEKTDEEIRLYVVDEIAGAESRITANITEGITLDVSSAEGSTTFKLTYNGAELCTDTLDLSVNAVNITGQLTAPQINATDLHVSAANVDGTLTASQIDATDLHVAAANITGTLTATQIDATNLQVAAANITGTLTAAQIDATNLQVTAANITGKLTFGQLPNTVATTGEVEEMATEAATTYIDEWCVSSPTIKGGTYQNLSGDTWFGLGLNSNRWGFLLANDDNEGGLFGVYNGDGGYTSFSGKNNYTFLQTDGAGGESYPRGTWDFTYATVTGLTVSGATAVFG